ncbi:MAG: hypothetical protein B7Y41_05085 [Hydrogenophilales bacterium 28-61-23]|nr:MAG: hypothetical protein B7Y41_05085 [Hydrogenophilales bacterium 28-61-23]
MLPISRVMQAISCALFMLFCVFSGAQAATGPLTVQVVDHVSNQVRAGLEVEALERLSDGSQVWRAKRVTDGQGQAQFDLDGLGSGRNYVVRAKPYQHVVYSETISQTGWRQFRVGKFQLQVMDGRSGAPLPGQALTLKRRQADGGYLWAMNAQTDAAGWIRVDPMVGGVDAYAVEARSPTDGEVKASEALWGQGPHRFVLGNEALVARVRDGVSGIGLGDVWVEALERLGNGSLVSRLMRKTDAEGAARFDLDGVGQGRRYVLRTQPYSYLDRVESVDLTQAGEHLLRLGKLQIQMLDSRNDQAYRWRDVLLLEVQADGTHKSAGTYKTDGSGWIKLDPAQLGTRPYQVRAASLLDGSLKDSAAYNTEGSYRFSVGSAGLTVQVVDHVSNQARAGLEVDALERLLDGSQVWRAKRVTDGQGQAQFDLDGLGSGRTYVVRAKPYQHVVYSEPISQLGWRQFRVGTSQITLNESLSNSNLAGREVIAFEKLPTGALRWQSQAFTDAQGQIKFDLPGLGKGAVYLFRAVNPFGDGKDYYSDLLTWWGAYTFALNQADINAPDRVPPQVSLAFPEQAASVSRGGFRLYGSASDDVSIKAVRAFLTLPSGAVLERVASYRADTGSWYVDTGSLGAEGPGTLGVRVVAVDSGLNESVAAVDLSLLDDRIAPNLEILSHAAGAATPMGGFVVTGRVTDNTLSPRLTVQVSGGGLTAAEVRDVEVAPTSGNWAVRVAPESGFSTAPITLTLTAHDGVGNTTAKSLVLNPSDAFGQAWHVLRRTAFGATPGQVAAVAGEGAVSYLTRQLHPDSEDDSDFAQRQLGWPDLGGYLATDYLRHAVYSRRQLLEVMTWFWDNHVNTDYWRHIKADYERYEMAGFRAHALGRFRDLLEVSSKSPAMLYTLDGVTNMMGRPNENYARELLELHTLGINGGYSQQDVVEVARAFTGWTVVDGQFSFNASLHDNGVKVVLGTTLPANAGQADGEAVLDLLARHPSTANFVCGKLVTLLVSDVPVNSLIEQCAGVFVNTVDAPDQLAQVLRAILSSPEFLGSAYRGAKLKTPLELTVGLARNLGGDLGLSSGGDDLVVELQRMNMSLFVNPSPTGYAETGKNWVSTGMLLNRIRFLDRALSATPSAGATQFNLAGLMQADGLETAEGVVGRMLDLTLGPIWTRRHWDLGMALLTEEGSRPYFAWAPDAEQRLRSLGKALAVLPEYQYQ